MSASRDDEQNGCEDVVYDMFHSVIIVLLYGFKCLF
jgi:hypothetical protein